MGISQGFQRKQEKIYNFNHIFYRKGLTNPAETDMITGWLAYANQEYFGRVIHMNLTAAIEGKEYLVQRIATEDEELDAFLFSLGCYAGEPITVISRRRGGLTVSIKDGRYNIDNQLAEAILI